MINDESDRRGANWKQLLNMCVCGVLVWLPYAFLIQCTMLLMALMTYPFLAAFVWLRISQPDVPRPFAVPGGLCGALLCTIPPFLVGTLYIYTCVFVEEDHTMGVPYFNVQCMVATIIIGLLFHLFYALCLRHCRDDPHSRSSLYDKL